jgi:hypothetical protein
LPSLITHIRQSDSTRGKERQSVHHGLLLLNTLLNWSLGLGGIYFSDASNHLFRSPSAGRPFGADSSQWGDGQPLRTNYRISEMSHGLCTAHDTSQEPALSRICSLPPSVFDARVKIGGRLGSTRRAPVLHHHSECSSQRGFPCWISNSVQLIDPD